jgi:hypothetical protein
MSAGACARAAAVTVNHHGIALKHSFTTETRIDAAKTLAAPTVSSGLNGVHGS